MREARSRLADWAVRKIEADYRDDVCLLLGWWRRHFDQEQEALSFHYYIPATSRSNGLARTFIIDGIGYDLFPMTWERIERIADFRGDNPMCLDQAEILYARNDDDRRTFTGLQARLRANLQNPRFMYTRAVDARNTAQHIHRDMLFEDDLHLVRESAGYICMHAANAVTYVNQQYLDMPDQVQITTQLSLKNVPAGFIDLYERIIRAKTADAQKRLCHDIIVMIGRFLDELDPNTVRRISAPDFSELAFWYQEMSYTWRRVYYWCDRHESINAYHWCCFLQKELDTVGMDFGIADVDILSAFNADDLPAFRKRAECIEQQIVTTIEAHGVQIESYPSVEAFLKHND